MNNTAVLLSVFNGEKFLKDLLDSLFNQKYKNFDVIVRDDGSIDNSIRIIKDYSQKLNITLIEHPLNKTKDKITNLANSFIYLTKYALKKNYQYYFYCDQDDIWMQEKLLCQLKYLIDKNYPCLVHSDLKLINSKNKFISESFWNWQKINSNRNDLKMLLFQNTVTGCASAFNKELASLLISIPERINHDNWAAIITSIEGKIIPIKDKLILYRQHDKNISGAGYQSQLKPRKLVEGILLCFKVFIYSLINKNYEFNNTNFEQTKCIIDDALELSKYLLKCNFNLSTKDKKFLQDFLNYNNFHIYNKILFIIKIKKFLPNNTMRRYLLMFLLLFNQIKK
jgi:glycosyltransferase involved in cell wall biosynthesis